MYTLYALLRVKTRCRAKKMGKENIIHKFYFFV